MSEHKHSQQAPIPGGVRLLKLKYNDKTCYAYKWQDEMNACFREINYVIYDPLTKQINCLLINCALRITGFPEMVSVRSIGIPVPNRPLSWEYAVTEWEDGEVDDDGEVRVCLPEAFSGRGDDLRRDMRTLLRQHRLGKGHCYTPAVKPPPAPATPTVTADAVQQVLAPAMTALTDAAQSLKSTTVPANVVHNLREENDALRKANAAPSEKFQEAVRQIITELPFPLGLIYDLRWNRKMSQNAIVKELRRLKIKNYRTKQRVGELLKEIEEKAKRRGYILSERVTGAQVLPENEVQYDEDVHGKTLLDPHSPFDNLVEKEEREYGWSHMKREEKISTLAQYDKAKPAEQATMREFYGPAFVKELNTRENIRNKKTRLEPQTEP